MVIFQAKNENTLKSKTAKNSKRCQLQIVIPMKFPRLIPQEGRPQSVYDYQQFNRKGIVLKKEVGDALNKTVTKIFKTI